MWQPFVAALLAPLLVWLLWRVQGVAVDEGLRRAMLKLLRRQRALYNVVSWLGTFIHEMSHAVVLILSGHGAKNFTVNTDSGHVQPRHMRKGPVAFLGFLAAAIAPLYIPPAIILGLLWWLHPGLITSPPPAASLEATLELAKDALVAFPMALGAAVANLDLTHWAHAGIAILALIALPSSRPSFVKGSKFHGDEGDIAVVRRKLRRRPLPFLVFLAIVYGLYFPLTVWMPLGYWWPFVVVWSVALAGILLALAGAAWWYLVALSARIIVVLAWVPYALLVGLQLLPRVSELGWSVALTNGVSFGAFAVAVVLLAVAARRRFY